MQHLPIDIFGEISKYLRYITWCQLKVVCKDVYSILSKQLTAYIPIKQNPYKTIKYLINTYTNNQIVELITNNEEKEIMIRCCWIKLFLTGNASTKVRKHSISVCKKNLNIWGDRAYIAFKDDILYQADNSIRSYVHNNTIDDYAHYCIKYGCHNGMMAKMPSQYTWPHYAKYGQLDKIRGISDISWDKRISYFFGRHNISNLDIVVARDIDWVQFSLGSMRYSNKKNFQLSISKDFYTVITSDTINLFKNILSNTDPDYMKFLEARGITREDINWIIKM